MIVQCPDCRSKYEITSPKDVTVLAKVRCPRCNAVFPARRRPRVEKHDGGRSSGAIEAAKDRRPRVHGAKARPRVTDPVLARRMARAMISEIVLSRESDREKGRLTGTLLSRFGPDIVAAFGIYGQKVSGDLPAFRSIFRDAVNDVLGKGQTVI